MNIGILGTGIIASSIVNGFCTDPGSAANLHFNLSPRNAEKAATLKASYPDNITVCSSNQEVIDNSEWVFITLLPRHADEVLSGLKFRADLKVLTIMSDFFIDKVAELVGPVQKIVRMVPLPFAAMHIGPIAYFPTDQEIADMFSPLGKMIALEKESEISIISGLTGLMSAYYMLVHETTKFGMEQGLSQKASIEYMTSFYEALDIKARAKEDGDLYELAYEMTPGGLNEMALKSILAEDGYQPWINALQKVMDRLNHR